MTPQTGSGSATGTISVDDCPDNGLPNSWRVYGDMCYTFGDIGMTWDNAKNQCETTAKSHFHQNGVYLIFFFLQFPFNFASIGSEGLNDFLYDWAQDVAPDQPIWVGGMLAPDEWTDGSTWGYTNWGSGEPSGPFEPRKCLHFNFNGGQGGWGDADCATWYPYFCSASPVPVNAK